MPVSDEVKAVKEAVVGVLGKCRVVVRKSNRCTWNALWVYIPEAHFKDAAKRAAVAAAVERVTGRGVVGSRDERGFARPYYTLSWS